MKTVLIALCLTLVSLDAHAISRYNSTSMSCAEARATVLAEGAVILRWRSPRGIQRYGRFVAHDGFCEWSEIAEIAYVPARDRASCPVLECKYYDLDDDFFPRFRRRH
jgi:hypothetical protein